MIALLLTPGSALALNSYTWTGASDQFWSAGNWGGPAPTANESIGTLTFPVLTSTPGCETGTQSTSCYSADDDLPGLSANALSIDDSAPYSLVGNGIDLGSGGLTAAPGGGAKWGIDNIGIPLVLSANQAWSITGTGPSANFGGASFYPSVSGASSALTVTLGTYGHANFLHSGAEVGPLTVEGANPADHGINSAVNGQLIATDLNGTDDNPVTLSDILLYDEPGQTATPTTLPTGPLTSNGASLAIGQGFSPDAILAAHGAVTLDGNSQSFFSIDETGTTPSTDFSQLQATGNVTLGGAISLFEGGDTHSNCAVSPGDVATIITTTGTLSGTFSNAPDGAVIPMQNTCLPSTSAPLAAVIHYTAHTVTATVESAGATSTTLTASPANPITNQTVTLTAVVASGTPLYAGPAGTVSFMDGSRAIPGCAAVALNASNATTGSATCAAAFAATGSPLPLTATFTPSGAGGLAPSTSPILDVPLGKAPTHTALSASSVTPATGHAVTYTARVTSVSPGAAAPSGTVSFADHGAMISTCRSQSVSAAGTATCTISYGSAGGHQVTGAYSGDGSFTGSTSAAAPVMVTAPSGSAHAGTPKVTGSSVAVPVSCSGKASCTVVLTLTVKATLKGSTIVAVSARKAKTTKRMLTLGTARVTLHGGRHETVTITLNRTGRRLLAQHHTLAAVLTVGQTRAGKVRTLASRKVTFKATKRKH